MHIPTIQSILPATLSTHTGRATPWLRHCLPAGPVALCTAAALVLALRAMPLTGGARITYAAAVAINVGLLALSSWSGILGALVTLWQRAGGQAGGPVLLPPTGHARTAVLLPVYEEDAERVFAAAAVMADQAARQALGTADLFVLSDTRSAEGAAAEESAFRRLLAQRPASVRRRSTTAAAPTMPAARPATSPSSAPLGRGVRLHGGAGRRQPDDGRGHRPAGGRDGGQPERRADPDHVLPGRPRHPVRPHPAVRRPAVRPAAGPRRRVLAGAARQLLGAQRHPARRRLRRALRPADAARPRPAGRRDPLPRHGGGRADAARRVGRLDAARGARTAATRARGRRRRPTCSTTCSATAAGARATCSTAPCCARTG